MKFAPAVAALFFVSMVPGPVFALAEGRGPALYVVQLVHAAVGFAGVAMCARRGTRRWGVRLVAGALLAALPVFVVAPFAGAWEVRWHSSAMMPYYVVARFAEPLAGGGERTAVIGYDLMSLMFLWVVGDYAWRREGRRDVPPMIDVAVVLALPLVGGGYGARVAGIGFSPLLLIVLTAIGVAVVATLRRRRWLHHSPRFVAGDNEPAVSPS